MHTHDYFILERQPSPSECIINDAPEPLDEKMWRIAKGEPMGSHYPIPARLDMDKAHGGIGVPDFINNNIHLPLVSGRLKQLLERESSAQIEFLPFTLYNHKKRIASSDCYIANVLDTYNCVDKDRTEGRESAARPGQYTGIFKLLLDHAKTPPEAKLFRISPKPSILIIRDDLRASIEEAGITGAKFIAMGEKCMIY